MKQILFLLLIFASVAHAQKAPSQSAPKVREIKPRTEDSKPLRPGMAYKPSSQKRANEFEFYVPVEVMEGFNDNAKSFEYMLSSRMVPEFNTGIPGVPGLKFLKVNTGSIFERMGFQTGDILIRINGKSRRAPQEFMKEFTFLGHADRTEFEILRAGSTRFHIVIKK